LVLGGLYVIEDLETNYWKKGKKVYGYPLSGGISKTVSAKDRAVEKFKQLIDLLPRYHNTNWMWKTLPYCQETS
jgi:hypothetical protein